MPDVDLVEVAKDLDEEDSVEIWLVRAPNRDG